jgi:cytochrome c oxidase subunit 3
VGTGEQEGAIGQTGGPDTQSVIPSRVEMFFVLYFFMTGLHAIHLVIGIVLVGIMAALSWRRWLSGGGVTQIEVTGLYWHFIDIVWVFLYPLLYLIERHQ